MSKKAQPRDTYKYHVKIGGRIVYRGITNDIERRSSQHKSRWPKSHITQIGQRTTRKKALEWERKGGLR